MLMHSVRTRPRILQTPVMVLRRVSYASVHKVLTLPSASQPTLQAPALGARHDAVWLPDDRGHSRSTELSMASSPRLQLRPLTVIVASLAILLTLGGLGYVVSGSIKFMATSADQMDDARALSAAKAALAALKKQLSATVRDNAYWDDAYESLENEGAKNWASENWGATTADYPLYDTALVVEPDGRSLIAFHKGVEFNDSDANSFFLGNLADVIAAARHAGYAAETLPVAFVDTRDGIALIGGAAIQPSKQPAFDMNAAKVLVFAKLLSQSVVAEIAETYDIRGLTLSGDVGSESMLHADVLDIHGRDIARVTWPPAHPGSASYQQVRRTVVASGIILTALLAAVAICGAVFLRAILSSERAAQYEAKHDALTGLWNRAGCLERLDAALAFNGGYHTTLYILDLDGFKPVNDAWGHLVGDQLIKAVATRLLSNLPTTATVARLGGDEFAVVENTPALEIGSSVLSQAIIDTMATPFLIDGRIIEIGGSVGWACLDTNGQEGSELLRRADLALYRAKSLGRGIAVNYDPSLDEEAGRHSELEQELRRGLKANEISVVFQPLVDASTRRLSGVEALARWSSPIRGSVPPDVFIPVAEKAGLIDQLGMQVLRTALREGMRWHSIGIAVNVSPLQLRNPYFCRQVRDALAESSFDPARLTIEVTEGVFISNPGQAKRAFDGLRALGVKIALDDFGCGYASIGTLREFGFDSMKIDRSLVTGLSGDDNAGAVFQATVALANALSLPVTAEGIETEEQATAVRLSGCEKLQGYLFSKPVPANEITSRYFVSSSAQAS